MMWVAGLIVVLILLGSVLAIAGVSIGRMTRVRAGTLRQEGRTNAAYLEEIALDPAPYLSSIYLAVMLAQNGSAIGVALLAMNHFGGLGIALVSVGFTLAYFVVVEAMSKTYGIVHSDRAALAVAPIVWALGRALARPARFLIGVANVLLPGKGLKQGPFATEEDLRSVAEGGHEEVVIEEREKDMIHSIFAFGATVVRQVKIPRPDVVAVEASAPLRAAVDMALANGVSRLPVYRDDLDHVEGVLHIRDALKALHEGRDDVALCELVRPAHFVPESKKAAEVLPDMQRQKFHLALVIDEYGSVSGLVTLEDLLEQLVGDIAEEHEQEVRDIEPLGDGRFRVEASLPVDELNDLLGTDLPRDRWNTAGGLMFGLLGVIPAEGQAVTLQGFRFTAEKLQGRRVTTILVTRESVPEPTG